MFRWHHTDNLELQPGRMLIRFLFPEQSSVSEAVSYTHLDVYKRQQLILQIHDELLIEAAEDEVDIVKKLLVDEMMHAADMTVPCLLYTSGFGYKGYDASSGF